MRFEMESHLVRQPCSDGRAFRRPYEEVVDLEEVVEAPPARWYIYADLPDRTGDAGAKRLSSHDLL